MISALALLPLSGTASNAADSRAQMQAAISWLATPWSDAQQKALHAGKPAGDPSAVMHVPGSSRSYTRQQLHASVPDWWPQDHSPMPLIVATGGGKALPCAECHGPNGVGIAHTATITGLQTAYILEQLDAFGDGSRANDEMHAEALGETAAQRKQAAEYFSTQHLNAARARVVQTTSVPRTRIRSWMLQSIERGGREPIGNRIIELPVNLQAVELGDTRARFVAYVPPGSVARGHALAVTGAGLTTACQSCHGPDLRGVGSIPPLAGRSPTYLTRQMVMFALGTRRGALAMPMQQEVAPLTLKDMISAAAYAATLKP
jgi:cytochrome c553